MASIYQISVSSYAQFIQTIADALEDKYGSGAVLYTDTQNVVFSPPATISDKVFKINRTTDAYNCRVYMGNSWTSGDKITDSVILVNYSGSQTHRSATLVLSDSLILLCVASSTSQQLLIARLDNGDYVAMGFGSSGTGLETSARQNIYPIIFNYPFTSAARYRYRQLSMFAIESGELITTDGITPATIPGLYNISYAASDPIYDTDKFIGQSGFSTNSVSLATSYLVYL